MRKTKKFFESLTSFIIFTCGMGVFELSFSESVSSLPPNGFSYCGRYSHRNFILALSYLNILLSFFRTLSRSNLRVSSVPYLRYSSYTAVREWGLSKRRSELKKGLPLRRPLSFMLIKDSFSMALMRKRIFPVKVEIESIEFFFVGK